MIETAESEISIMTFTVRLAGFRRGCVTGSGE